MDAHREAAHLSLADQHIAEGEARVALQRELIAHLKRRGAGTDEAEDFLGLLRETVDRCRQHRELMAATLDRLHSPEDRFRASREPEGEGTEGQSAAKGMLVGPDGETGR
ncbi:MAG: hypothetical protein ACJ8FN_07630 [Sphingomicrobium sp.]